MKNAKNPSRTTTHGKTAKERAGRVSSSQSRRGYSSPPQSRRGSASRPKRRDM